MPPAWYPDGYWDTFYWDVSNGDCGPADYESPGGTLSAAAVVAPDG